MPKILNIDSAAPEDRNPAAAPLDDIRCLEDRLTAEYSPATPTEEILVRQLAVLAWRLGKMPVYEAARMREFESPSESAAEAWPQVLRLWRHQSAFLNQFQAALRELRKLQASRLSAAAAPVFPNFLDLVSTAGSPPPDPARQDPAPSETLASAPPPDASGLPASPEPQAEPAGSRADSPDPATPKTPLAVAGEPAPANEATHSALPAGPPDATNEAMHSPVAATPPDAPNEATHSALPAEPPDATNEAMHSPVPGEPPESPNEAILARHPVVVLPLHHPSRASVPPAPPPEAPGTA